MGLPGEPGPPGGRHLLFGGRLFGWDRRASIFALFEALSHASDFRPPVWGAFCLSKWSCLLFAVVTWASMFGLLRSPFPRRWPPASSLGTILALMVFMVSKPPEPHFCHRWRHICPTSSSTPGPAECAKRLNNNKKSKTYIFFKIKFLVYVSKVFFVYFSLLFNRFAHSAGPGVENIVGTVWPQLRGTGARRGG